MTVAHYKEILKTVYGEPSFNMFLDTMSDVISDLTAINKKEIMEFNIVDIFLILLELRIFSLGNTCKVVVNAEENKKLNVELSLAGIKEDIKNFSFFEKLRKFKRQDFSLQNSFEEFKNSVETTVLLFKVLRNK